MTELIWRRTWHGIQIPVPRSREPKRNGAAVREAQRAGETTLRQKIVFKVSKVIYTYIINARPNVL